MLGVLGSEDSLAHAVVNNRDKRGIQILVFIEMSPKGMVANTKIALL